MDSYRVEKRAMHKIILPDEPGEVPPVPTTGGGGQTETELDQLSNILKVFNDHFADIDWGDDDRIRKLITEEIPVRVGADVAYQNAMKRGAINRMLV